MNTNMDASVSSSIPSEDRMTAEHCRLTYQAPLLTRYGSVAALTMNGGASGSDGTGNSMTVRGSDIALKHDVVQVGKHPLGFGLYLFEYKPEFGHFGSGRQFGVMAQEVEQVLPEAVSIGEDGYRRVNYTMLGISHPVH